MNSVDICNTALSLCGVDRAIQSLDGTDKSARMCKTFFVKTRDALLRSYFWRFATKRTSLAQLTSSLDGWDYAYAYPSDCLMIRKIVGTNDTDTTKNEYEVRATGSDLAVLADIDDAQAVYTVRQEDPNLFDPLFVMALAHNLASVIVVGLTGNLEAKQLIDRDLQNLMGRAIYVNAIESYEKPASVERYFSARG